MKASFVISNHYLGPEPYRYSDWPTPPRLSDPHVSGQSAELAFALAQAADEAGFDWVSCSEHHYMPGLQTPNPIVFAAALCRVVKRAKIAVLGPLVSMTNPVRTAEELAMLDQLSGGRLITLFLRGTPNEFVAYGVNPAETRAVTQEASELIVRALTEPEPFGWEGRHFRFRTISVWPKVVQQPHPPVYYSGNSIESANYAAAHQFGLGISFYPQPLVAKLAEHYRQECARWGWSPRPDQLIYRAFVGVTDTDKEAAAMKSRFFGLSGFAANGRADAGGAPNFDIAAVPTEIGTDADGKNKDADKSQAGFGFGGLEFCGSPDTVVEQIRQFNELTGIGVVDLIFGGAGLMPEEVARSFSLFCSDVLPKIRGIGEKPSEKVAAALVEGTLS